MDARGSFSFATPQLEPAGIISVSVRPGEMDEHSSDIMMNDIQYI